MINQKIMAFFSNIKNAFRLFKQIDMHQLNKLSEKVNIAEVIKNVNTLDDKQLAGLTKMLGGHHHKKELPAIDGDFYDIAHTLTADERKLQLTVRAFMETEIKPIVNDYWLRAEFPHHILSKVAELNICGITYQGFNNPVRSCLMEGILAMEMARVDVSFATFFGVQSGLVMGSIYLLGSEQQKQEWLPQLKSFKKISDFENCYN